MISNKISELAARGIRSLGIAVCQAKDDDNEWSGWRFIGILTFLDPPRHDTKLTIERAQNLGKYIISFPVVLCAVGIAHVQVTVGPQLIRLRPLGDRCETAGVGED